MNRAGKVIRITNSDIFKAALQMPLNRGYGMAFMHELSHTTPGGKLSDIPHDPANNYGNPGPVETRLNQVRSELNAQGGNYGQRLSYIGLNNRAAGVGYFPFSNRAVIDMLAGNAPASYGKHIVYKRLR